MELPYIRLLLCPRRQLSINKPSLFLMKKLLLLLVSLVSITVMYGQGVTTGSLSGQIVDQNGEPLIGSTISAVHLPTGTFYGAGTDLNGNYRIDNMKVGGPYRVNATYIGQNDVTLENIYVKLGQVSRQNLTLGENATQIEEIVVTATAGSTGQNSGTSTNISTEQIELMPTLNRSLSDYTRLTPQSRSTFGGGTSLGGQNNRYNAIYVDGAVNNDVFGLTDNGQNGGDSGIAPFSIDAIDQIQVVLSPFDVTFGGFAGGGISAVTKSGTNCLTGTAYYFNQNEGIAGKTNGLLLDRIGSDEGTRLDEFNNTTYGLSLGGPIVKDKVFFFVNAEIQDDQTPQPFAGEYDGNTSLEEIEQLGSFLRDTYGYDPGDFGNRVSSVESTKLFAKVDFNLNEDHKLTLRHNYVDASNLDLNGSSNTTINFANNGELRPNTTNSSALELNSRIGNNMSNNLIVGYTTVVDDRDPLGQDFPSVFIRDGDGAISFGGDAFSPANFLEQKTLTITDNFKIYKGDHTFTIGTHNEFISIDNLFIRQNFGSYFYLSLDNFYNDIVTGYDRSFSLVDDITGDASGARAEFNAAQFGLYIQDEWAASNKLTLTGGLRVDLPVLQTDPRIAADFNSTTLVAISEQYDLQGARGGQAPSAQLMFSPRLGFNYDASINTRVRGGLGIFTSRIPFVWPGGMYSNNGFTIGGIDEDDIDNLSFSADPLNQPASANVALGQIDLFAEDFRYPQVFRASLALDQDFGDGWSASLEGMYTKTLNNVFYQNVNSDPTVDFNWTNGDDDRPIFTRTDIDDTYNAIYLASNTNEGYAYNVTGSLSKRFDIGLNLFAAYTFGDAEAIFEGTSSQNSSQWRGAFTTDGRNNAILGRSDFAIGTRVVGSAGYTIDWTKDGNFNTNISLFYNGQSGNWYSYVYNQRNVANETGSNNRERSLIYVPETSNDIVLVDNGDMTAEEQWTLLDRFIEEDDYLSTRRGQYAEKNGSRTPFTHQFDLRIAQDLGVNIGGRGNKLQLSFDIFNVGNLINNEWGTIYFNPFAYRLIDFEGYQADGTTPTFSFSEEELGNDRFGIADRTSRWRGRVGLRYIFGGANDCSPTTGFTNVGNDNASASANKKLDSDGDGVKDHKDLCPDVPGEKKYKGCPMEYNAYMAKLQAEKEAKMAADEAARVKAEAEAMARKEAEAAKMKAQAEAAKMKAAEEAKMKAEAEAMEAAKMKAAEETKMKAAAARTAEINSSFNAALRGIVFNSGKSTFKQESYTVMDNVIAVMQKYTDLNVSIEGHTDSQGGESANSALSASRANAVKDYLVSKGVSATRLSTRGFGEYRPVGDNNTAAGRALNRRVEFVIKK